MESNAYRARVRRCRKLGRRPRVLHVIANFKTGGSSRLVVDLFERLGHVYRQEVITSSLPAPAHYTGLRVTEYRGEDLTQKMTAHLRFFSPDLAHVHYWGDMDEPWYASFFEAAKSSGCRIVENINTPVAPFKNPRVKKYVYVSEYVRENFGEAGPGHEVIYPGSDFELFGQHAPAAAADCIGMVYRLEPDKLNAQSIEPLILAVKKKPSIKILIIGDGPLLGVYKEAVRTAGVEKAFEFTGRVSYAALPSYYRRMKVFAAPVWKESFGHVSPLAIRMGVPVAGYDIGALAEITGDRALLAPPQDSEALADILVTLDTDETVRNASAERQKKFLRPEFSVETMIGRYHDLYSRILRRHP